MFFISTSFQTPLWCLKVNGCDFISDTTVVSETGCFLRAAFYSRAVVTVARPLASNRPPSPWRNPCGCLRDAVRGRTNAVSRPFAVARIPYLRATCAVAVSRPSVVARFPSHHLGMIADSLQTPLWCLKPHTECLRKAVQRSSPSATEGVTSLTRFRHHCGVRGSMAS